MKRRIFLGTVAAATASVMTPFTNKVLADPKNKYDKYLKFPVDVSTTIEFDPFIKIYIKKSLTINYGGIHKFYQHCDNSITYTQNIDNISKSEWFIPLDSKDNQKSKEDMIKNTKTWKCKNITYFEIITDNGKSNLFIIGTDV